MSVKEYKIALLPGDGIGPEVVKQATKVLKAVEQRFEVKFDVLESLIGGVAIDEANNPLPAETIDNCMDSDAILLGAIGHPKYDNDPKSKLRPEQGLLGLRGALKLHTNIRPVRSYSFLNEQSPLKNDLLKGVNINIYRELTGGIYFGEKTKSKDGLRASDLCAYSRGEIERIAVKAFEAAEQKKGKLTLVDKANVLETSRLWRTVIQEMSSDYPEVEVDYLYVDNAAMQIVTKPSSFDIILTENMFGDILSDIASVLCGSLGLLPSASIGDRFSLFEPVHGSYPQVAGLDKANPVATILSLQMMLRHLGLREAAFAVQEAVDWSLEKGFSTEDVNQNNPISCSMVGDLIALRVENGAGFNPDENYVNRGTYYI
ncbi:MAG: 3-isopropylmalate dehydrogenase [Bacteroidota bacterium]